MNDLSSEGSLLGDVDSNVTPRGNIRSRSPQVSRALFQNSPGKPPWWMDSPCCDEFFEREVKGDQLRSDFAELPAAV